MQRKNKTRRRHLHAKAPRRRGEAPRNPRMEEGFFNRSFNRLNRSNRASRPVYDRFTSRDRRTGKGLEKGCDRMGKFVIKTTDAGCHFVLKADNGEVIATSQVYKSKESCKKGIESVKKNAPEAAVLEEE